MELETPDYTVELWDINDNYVLDISRFVELDITLKLNDADIVTFDIDLVQFNNLCLSVGLVPRNVLYPLKTQCVIRRNGVLLTAGRVSVSDTSKGEDGVKKQSVTVDGYEQYFAKRFISQSWAATDRSQIAWEAIDAVQSLPNGDLGVVRGVHTDTYDSDLTADYMSVKDIMQKYTYVQPTTYDFEIAVDVVDGAITKTFNTYLFKGTDRPDVRLVDPRNISNFNVNRSGDTMANKVIGLGALVAGSRLESIQEDEPSQIEYLIQEDKESFSSVEQQDTLDDDTAGVLEQSRTVLATFNCVAEPGVIDPNVVKVGDSVYCRVDNDPYNDDIAGMYRIYAMNIKVDNERKEAITPSFYNPGTGGEIGEA